MTQCAKPLDAASVIPSSPAPARWLSRDVWRNLQSKSAVVNVDRSSFSGIAVLAIAALAVAGYAQTQIRTRVDLVVVPVTVRDSDGKLVAGLTKEDFRVTEDGKPQTVTDFDIDPQPLSAAIVIDDGMSRDKLQRLFPLGSAPLLITLTSGFSPDDQMAAFRYDHEVHKLMDFTNDQDAIQKSLEGIEKIAETRPDEPGDILGEKGPGWLRSILNVLTPGPGYKPQAGGGSPVPTPPRVASAPRPSSRVLNDAIYEAGLALQSQPADRRKIIFIVSDGQTYGKTAHTFDQTVDLLVRSDIQVYGVSANAATFGSFGMLTSYARATGGDVYPGTSIKSMETAFGRITEQARNQYILGYVSNNTAERLAVFRSIQVKTGSSQHTVIHRKGYTQYPTP
jgi:VWFA-related protein